MKVFLRNIFFFFLLGLLVKCDDEEVSSRNYPRLKTHAVTDITTDGAKFNAEIVYRGNFKILNYGFVWSDKDYPTKENSDRIVYSTNIQSSDFSEFIETTLKQQTLYYVRAFVETSDFVVYGEIVSFISLGSQAPKIYNISPLQGTIGDTIIIVGQNFSYIPQENLILFNDASNQLNEGDPNPLNQQVSGVITCSDSMIVTLIPELSQTSSKISVAIAGNKSTYSEQFKLLPPMITSLSSEEGKTYDTISIYGKYFGSNILHTEVLFGEINAEIINFYRDSLEVVVPSGVASSKLEVKVANQSDEISFNYLRPSILDFNPKEVSWKDTIKVNVKNFYKNPDLQILKLNGVQHDILRAYEDSVIFVIPEDLLIYDAVNVTTKTTSIGFEIAGFDLLYNESAKFKNPIITHISLDTVEVGDLVEIDVQNLHPISSNNGGLIRYKWGYSQRINITQVSPNKVEFIFPNLNSYYQQYNGGSDRLTIEIFVKNMIGLLHAKGTVIYRETN